MAPGSQPSDDVGTKQVARHLGLSPRAVSVLAKNGCLPVARRVGRSYRFRLEDIDRWRIGVHLPEQRQHRSVRETSVYDAAIGLYGVLVGVAMLEPLQAFADDLFHDPIRGNWELRFLAIGLFLEAATWFHALMAETNLTIIAPLVPRHSTNTGVTDLSGYKSAIRDLWFGAGVVIILVLLAKAVRLGTTVFLGVFVVYLVVSAIWTAAFLWSIRETATSVWDAIAHDPISLHRQLKLYRHLPATPADLEALAGGSAISEVMNRVEELWATEEWWALWSYVGLAAVSALLLVAALALPWLVALVALSWLACVAVLIVHSYWAIPYFWAA